MDKFDESIKNAQLMHEPSNDFVDNTMKQIEVRQPKKHWSIKIWGPALAGGLAVLALIFVVIPHTVNNTGTKTSNLTGNAVKTQSGQQPTSSVGSAGIQNTAAPGTDDASLQNDLNGVQGQINQENSDQYGANSAINDSQQEITVPST
jgi:hypothetical protein